MVINHCTVLCMILLKSLRGGKFHQSESLRLLEVLITTSAEKGKGKGKGKGVQMKKISAYANAHNVASRSRAVLLTRVKYPPIIIVFNS